MKGVDTRAYRRGGSRQAGILALMIVLASCGSAPPDNAESTPPSSPTPAETQAPKVTHFYATPRLVSQGDDVTVCYGVENAESGRVDPPIRDLRPSRNRCFSFAPQKTGAYRLIASGSGGQEDAAELSIKVDPAERPKPPESSLISLFLANQTSVPRGSLVTLCYTVEGAESVEIQPPVRELKPEQTCFTVRMEETTTFQLTAHGAGRTEEKQLTVEVQ